MANQILAGAVFHAGQVIAGVDADNPPYVGPPVGKWVTRSNTFPRSIFIRSVLDIDADPVTIENSTTSHFGNNAVSDSNGRYLAISDHVNDKVFVYNTQDLSSAPTEISSPGLNFSMCMSADKIFVGQNPVKAYDLSDLSAAPTLISPPSNEVASGAFGAELACNSTHLFIGSYTARINQTGGVETSGVNSESGKVHVWNIDTEQYETDLYGIDPEYGDKFGSEIRVTDTHVAIGAYGADSSPGYQPETGAVYLFDAQDLSATPTKLTGGGYADGFGQTIDLNDTHLAVSESSNSDNQSENGKLFIYPLNNMSSPIVATGTLYSERFGSNPVLFNDGSNRISFYRSLANLGQPASYFVYDINDLSTPLWQEEVVTERPILMMSPYVAPPAPLPSYDWSSASLSLTLSNQIDGSSKDFGRSLATSGDYHVVSQPQSYEVNVFDNSGNLVRTIPHPEGRTVHYFGGDTSVWVTGNKLLLSDSGSPEGSINSSGKAWLFDVTTGSILHTFLPETPRQMDRLGQVSAMSENYVALLYGQSESNQTAEDTAKVAIYDVSTGSLLRVISPAIWEANQLWGQYPGTITISGNYISIAASKRGPSSGAVEIFDITTGNHLRTLDNPNVFGTTNNDNFGKSLSSSGNYLAVGTADEDSSLGNGRGVVYVYDVTDGSLLHTLSSSDTQSIGFGACVSMSGKHLAVSDYLTSSYLGVVYVYDVTDGSLVYTASNPTPETYDFMGKPVSMSGGTLLTVAKQGDPAEAYVWTAPLL
jgi:hypothetical protein